MVAYAYHPKIFFFPAFFLMNKQNIKFFKFQMIYKQKQFRFENNLLLF